MRLNFKRWRTLRREPWRKLFYEAFDTWRADKGEALRRQFPGLPADPVVFDMGGFEGNWAVEVAEAHGGTFHIFEPHPRFAQALQERFAGQPQMHVYPFALGQKAGRLDLSDTGDASSAIVQGERAVSGQIEAVEDFFAQHDIPTIDLMKVNIEGGEYDLLPALIGSGLMARIGLLQVQFHLYAQSDIDQREALRADLAKTHLCDWAYPFVWEQWSRKPRES